MTEGTAARGGPARAPWGTDGLRRAARGALARCGYEVRRRPPAPADGAGAWGTGPWGEGAPPPDFDDEVVATVDAVHGYTLTPPERVFALCEAVRYVVRAGLPGALVECGVWRGGSALAMVRTLLSLGATDRDLYLFDTFERMPDPGPEDVDLLGVPAAEYHAMLERGADYDHRYDFLPYAEVQALLRGSGYPVDRLHFVKGLVEDTLPEHAPDVVALLRLDTDYYQSTAHELVHLYPRIPAGGVLVVDDYGHFRGCRQAVDEHLAALAEEGSHLLLNRIDYSARIAVVPPFPPSRSSPPAGASCRYGRAGATRTEP